MPKPRYIAPRQQQEIPPGCCLAGVPIVV
jgi:hypothetical protein